MSLKNFSDANKQLIEYKPLFNKVVKTAEVFDVEKSYFSNKIINNKSVLLICDFEGKIVFIDETFGNLICRDNLVENSILDFLHPEDIPVVIEQLVHLLQEKSQSITIDVRIVALDNQKFVSKWHVGYMRGFFYFYPFRIPNFLINILDSPETDEQNLKSQKSILPTQLLWKIEVSKTLYEWDSLIFKQIKSFTTIQEPYV